MCAKKTKATEAKKKFFAVKTKIAKKAKPNKINPSDLLPANEDIIKSRIVLLKSWLKEWKERNANDKKSLEIAKKQKNKMDIDYFSKEVNALNKRIMEIEKELKELSLKSTPKKKTVQRVKANKPKTTQHSANKKSITKADLKHSKDVSASKLEMFEAMNPKLFNPTNKPAKKKSIIPKEDTYDSFKKQISNQIKGLKEERKERWNLYQKTLKGKNALDIKLWKEEVELYDRLIKKKENLLKEIELEKSNK